MGAPSAQVQSSQSSDPASKGAGTSPSTPGGNGKGSMSATSGQPMLGSPNTNGNTGMAPVNPNFVGQTDVIPSGNPYPNTIDNTGAGISPSTPGGSGKGSMSATPDVVPSGNPYPNTIDNTGAVAGGPNGLPMSQPMAKGAGGGQGGGQGGGKGSAFVGDVENPGSGPQGTGATY